ncbi:hypothetical protein HLK59_47600 [Streptomyces sp. S3(2020)]|uniref:hypothetical protein n=1 Tax=Streptomyces sp. S3(2020) TaxID=2732044 RepID=UPI001489C323|nr:hypothetical protein [Streptomyces sp. S3(2020)]NNN37858.1 hypothetical protein [Streptomyces sp. S3(2020)]
MRISRRAILRAPWQPGPVPPTDAPVLVGVRELKEFVGRPDHLRIVRAHRGRGELRSVTREFATFEPSALWDYALDLITEEQ